MRQAGAVPTFRVKVNGRELPTEALGDLIAAAVIEDVDAPGMFEIRVRNWDMDKLEVTWADDKLFKEGGEVELRMGYVDALEKLMVGEITGLEPTFNARDTPMLTVRGYDRRHRLMRGRKTRSFTQMKDSDVAKKIASQAGLTGKAVDTGVVIEYLLQRNQTDMEFLQSRARRIGYEVVIDDKTLEFRPRPADKKEAVTLTRSADLIEFSPRLTTMPLTADVEVHGWSPKDKKEIVAKAAKQSGTMGGKTGGPKAAQTAFGKSTGGYVDWPVSTKGEADKIAQGRLDEMALGYILGEGICLGRTDLRAGTVAKIEGVGKRFSGSYYVTSTRHTFIPRRGYQTAFSVRRNAT